MEVAGEKTFPVWDWPVRVIHWYFPLAIAFMWWSGEEGEMEWHSWVGYSLIIAAATRIVWGFVGSYHARFGNFLRSPAAVLAYFRSGEHAGPGHNPAGGYATLVMLVLIFCHGVVGLFSNDDIAFEGPLAYWAGDLSYTFTEIHEAGWTALKALIILHLSAVLYYQFVRRKKILRAMVTGQADGASDTPAPAPLWRALLVLAICGGALAAVLAVAPEAPSYY